METSEEYEYDPEEAYDSYDFSPMQVKGGKGGKSDKKNKGYNTLHSGAGTRAKQALVEKGFSEKKEPSKKK
jgi:hypothetical protein